MASRTESGMKRGTVKAWYLVHKWTSLVCTAFLLLLCVTGLPLIFWEEIAHLTDGQGELSAPDPGQKPANIDGLLAKALTKHPGNVPLFFSWDDHEPAVFVTTGARPDTPPSEMNTVMMHAYTGEIIDVPSFNEGVMYFLYRLHTDIFLGLGAMLFMGAMGLLFAVAIVSGLVIYGPFMRKLDFGTVRRTGSSRLKWLDMHNLLGAVTLAWALVVGLTGVINTLAEPLQQKWQAEVVAKFAAHYADSPRPKAFSSLNAAIATARAAAPGMTPSFVSFPGTGYSGDHHLGVFMHGATPLTERISRPVLIDAATGELTAMPEIPGYMLTLLLSQPLHFGDYGGMPLKILWALLDIVTIIVLGSGLYLWIKRAKGSADTRVVEIVEGGRIAESRA